MKNIVIKRFKLIDLISGKCSDIQYHLYYEDGTPIMNTDIDGMIEFLKSIHNDKIEIEL